MQLLCAIVADKRHPNLDPAQLNLAAQDIWAGEIWDETTAILQANRAALNALAGELHRLGEVRGRALRTVLAQVQRRDA